MKKQGASKLNSTLTITAECTFSYIHLHCRKRWSNTQGIANIPHQKAIPLPTAVLEREQWQHWRLSS